MATNRLNSFHVQPLLNALADKTDQPREICEHILAHKRPDEVEVAYLRGAYLEKRKSLMADWASFSNR